MNRRDFLKLSGAVAASPIVQQRGMTFPDGVLTEIPGGEIVTLTIDDGWEPMVMRIMLENLRQSWVYATWFLIGQPMLRNFSEWDRAEELRYLMWFGNHEIAYHSMRHEVIETVVKWKRAQWQADYDEWIETFVRIWGWEGKPAPEAEVPWLGMYARAPWGLFTDAFMEMAKDNGLRPIGWSNDLTEWRWGRPIQSDQIVLTHARLADHELINHLLYLRRSSSLMVTDLWHSLRAQQIRLEEERKRRPRIGVQPI